MYIVLVLGFVKLIKKSDLSEDDIMLSFNVCLNYLYIFYEILI